MGDDVLVLGLTLNSETCHQVVDRGPPAENVEATREFLQLWGKEKAQLRRFKDGAIVHAVVWNTHDDANNNNAHHVQMEGNERAQGGIVERIVQHVINLHFGKPIHNTKMQFALGDMLSLVEGVATSSNSTKDKLLSSSHAAFKGAMSAFGSLSEILCQNSSPTVPAPGSADAKTSRLGVPLAIDAVEPLSPTLRYSELFPPLPHPSLGGPRGVGKKVSGVAPPPILIQIRFGLSSKWPTDLKAMGAAKTAMLIQLADGIESMKHSSDFEGPIQVTPSYIDFGYKGYSWHLIVRAEAELNMLRKLQKPSPEAVSLLRVLSREHVVSAMHHSMIHGIHTSYPSSCSVTWLAQRWISAHLLSNLLPLEAVKLLVAKVYTGRDVPLDPPATVVSGFLCFLHLLASHDWSCLSVLVAGPDLMYRPPMYIILPNDRIGDEEGKGTASKNKTPSLWTPTFTQQNPDSVVLSRAAALAKGLHDFLMNCLSNDKNVDGRVSFKKRHCPSKSYIYRNLSVGDKDAVLYNWQPVKEMVQMLQNKFGSLALFFYNDLSPEVVAVLWRPTSFVPQAFSAMHSERVVPIDAENWKSDILVIHNISNVLQEMKQITDGILSDIKVLDDPTEKARPSTRKRAVADEPDDGSSSGDSD